LRTGIGHNGGKPEPGEVVVAPKAGRLRGRGGVFRHGFSLSVIFSARFVYIFVSESEFAGFKDAQDKG
jgi:hypothetical protein